MSTLTTQSKFMWCWWSLNALHLTSLGYGRIFRVNLRQLNPQFLLQVCIPCVAVQSVYKAKWVSWYKEGYVSVCTRSIVILLYVLEHISSFSANVLYTQDPNEETNPTIEASRVDLLVDISQVFSAPYVHESITHQSRVCRNHLVF